MNEVGKKGCWTCVFKNWAFYFYGDFGKVDRLAFFHYYNSGIICINSHFILFIPQRYLVGNRKY